MIVDEVTIIIPSCSTGRLGLLMSTIRSILANTYKRIHLVVVADGNEEIYRAIKKEFDTLQVTVISNEKRMDWVFSINRVLKEFDSDYYIYASDDLIFPPDCIEKAMKTMERRFPDGFGVVSIGKKNRSAFGLFGRKLADHFPDRQVICPDFIHYAGDSELHRTVTTLGKYAFPPERESQVKHFRMKDDTWRLARKIRNRDHTIRREREEKGYMWGVDFNLIAGKR